MKEITIPRDSVEYVRAPVTADVDLGMGVEISIRYGTAAHVWLPATWVGTLGPSRTARTTTQVTFSAALYPKPAYTVYVRLTDTPEVPIIEAGTIKITA